MQIPAGRDHAHCLPGCLPRCSGRIPHSRQHRVMPRNGNHRLHITQEMGNRWLTDMTGLHTAVHTGEQRAPRPVSGYQHSQAQTPWGRSRQRQTTKRHEQQARSHPMGTSNTCTRMFCLGPCTRVVRTPHAWIGAPLPAGRGSRGRKRVERRTGGTSSESAVFPGLYRTIDPNQMEIRSCCC